MNAVLRPLQNFMRDLEKQRSERLARGDHPVEVDRDVAEFALAQVVDFFLDCKIESGPLYRLLCEVVALSSGASPSPMLLPAKTCHRRPDPPAVENIKGRLAAVMENRQCAGLTRKAARQWVVRNTPAAMKNWLGLKSPTTVDSWLSKWGGSRGATQGPGRDGYHAMSRILKEHKPAEAQLKRMIAVGMSKSIPARESI